MEEYLTVKELSERVKLAPQTIYNFIHLQKFILGKHYLKPTRRKVLFKWSEIRKWMGEDADPSIQANETISREPVTPPKAPASNQPKSLINI